MLNMNLKSLSLSGRSPLRNLTLLVDLSAVRALVEAGCCCGAAVAAAACGGCNDSVTFSLFVSSRLNFKNIVYVYIELLWFH